MSFGNGFLDIILFAVIAGAILIRLRNVLGERDDNDPAPIQLTTTQVDTTTPATTTPNTATSTNLNQWANALPNYDWVTNATAHQQLAPFTALDPQFHPADFIEKAKKAFAMILKAYSEGNRNTLDFLLDKDVYNSFIAQIDAREAAHESYQLTLHGIKKALISGARLSGSVGEITVDFTAEQSIIHRNANGDFINHLDGDKTTTTDRWSFSKDLRGSDAVWRLTRTEDLDD
jgi:predicted lipid-binding transport protein (Tim44 family)